MGDLISRKKAYEVLTEYYHHKSDLQHLDLIRALDRVPDAPGRKVGKWITDKDSIEYATCSVCGHCDWDCTESMYFNFCPNCGAYMKGELSND